MSKIDHKREFKELYGASAKAISIVQAPPLNFLMIDGMGNPNISQGFQQAVEALFTLSYTLKFTARKGPTGVDYTVMPLEGLWWMDDMSRFSMDRKDEWKWTLMIMQPGVVTKDLLTDGAKQVEKKKRLPALQQVRFEALHEGRCAQVLHVGPYEEVPPTIQRLHDFVLGQGFRLRGKHHEIYLSDPRKTAPEKLKTILRHPIEPAA